MMITIPFIQYHLPNGKASKQNIDFQDNELENPEQFKKKIKELLSNNVHFDAEILTTGVVSFTAERFDDTLSIQLSNNGPEVYKAMENLILDAYETLASIEKENND